jgi:sporulation protein YlmC with PRC-barrel domain
MNRLMTSAALALALTATAAYGQTTGPQTQQSPAMNQSQSGTMGSGMAMQQSGEYMADDIIGTSVRNQQNENIGSVSDLVIDRNGQVKAAVVSVGGFLGIGDKHVAVPWNQLQVGADTGVADRGTTASGAADRSAATGSTAAARDPVLRVNMTKEQLQQAPEFKSMSDQARGSRGTSPAGSGGDPNAPQRGTTSPSR